MADVVSKLIAEAASSALKPLGLRRREQSRLWLDDRGWWLINVEFQPSSGRKGCYLNVGHQHLWVRRDYLVFDEPERPLGSSAFVAFEGDSQDFSKQVARAAGLAAEAVVARRVAHGEGTDALHKIAVARNDLDAGIALAILGDSEHASDRLKGKVHPADQELAASYLSLDRDAATAAARQGVVGSRESLRLSAEWSGWDEQHHLPASTAEGNRLSGTS